MTAVGPVSLETVFDVENGKLSQPVSLFVQKNRTTLGNVLSEDEIVPKHRMTIAEGLHPLFTSMRWFGLYCGRPSGDTGDDTHKKSRKWKAYRIYAAAVVTLLWINAVRMFTLFTSNDKFGFILFNKLIMLIWFIQVAISQTAFYAASFSGRLEVVLRQPLEDSCAKHARKFSSIWTVVAWSLIVVGLSFFIYGLFFDDSISDMMITPFQIHITISNTIIPRIVALIIIVYSLSTYIFSQTITFVLAMIFSHQFKTVIKNLRSRLDNPQRRVSDLDIETLRQKHQEISNNVDYVDDCLMFSNAAAFCCQLSTFIIILYTLIFYHSFMTDPVMISSYVFWLLALSFGLTLTAAGGITVHHYVSIFSVSVLILLIIA